MSLTMHQAAVPALLQILNSLDGLLDKASDYCAARKIDESVILNYRLSPDMFAFARQIQTVTDQAKGAVARLSGQEPPVYEDTEKSLAELKARVAKTISFIRSFKPEQMNGSENREIVLKIGTFELRFIGTQFLFHFVFPNFYFHATAAYAILRHCGADIGKRDFLGSLDPAQ